MLKYTMLALVMALTGCSDNGDKKEASTTSTYDEKGTPAKGDILVSASIGEASNLVPFLAGDSASHDIAGLIYNGLLKYDKNANLVGDLAEKWEISDDNLTFTFHLKKNVLWDDGTPLTAHDVIATFNVQTHPDTRTPYKGDYEDITEIKAVDDHTVQVTYNEPFSPALASWATFSVLPKHRLDKVEDIHTSDLVRNPMGTGAYRLHKWDSGKEIVMQANENYHEHEPWMTLRRIRYIPDTDTQFLELKAGRIDVMGLKPVQFTRLTDKDEFTSRYAKYKYLANGYTYMGFKLDHPLFKDKKVRHALSYATPREQLIKGVLHGQGLPIAGVFKPGTWGYNENLKSLPYDVEKAKQLLAEAGWKDTDGDGVIEKDGRPFKFTLVTNQGNDQRRKTAEILQQAFRAIGIEMEILIQEWATFINNTIDTRNFDAFILGWSLSLEPDPYDIWHSSKTGKKEFNIVGFNNAEADELMIKARRTFDQAERKKYLDRFQEIIHDEQPYLFLYAPYALVAMHKRIKNIEPSPIGLSHNLIDWYVPQSQQLYKAAMVK